MTTEISSVEHIIFFRLDCHGFSGLTEISHAMNRYSSLYVERLARKLIFHRQWKGQEI